jgi:O-antigen/teichoic acid export membrane protein
MGIIIRQGIQTSIIAYAGVAIGAFNVLWLFPKFLDAGQIGLITAIQNIAMLFAALARLGTPRITEKFFPVFRNHEAGHHGFLSLLMAYGALGFSFFCLIFLLFRDFWLSIYEENAEALNQYYYHLIPLVLFLILQGILEAYMRVHLKTVTTSFYREVVLKVLLAVVVLLYFAGWISFPQLVTGIVVIYGLLDLLLFQYIFQSKVMFLKIQQQFLNKVLLKEMVQYSLFIVLSGLGSVIVAKIDTLMIPYLLGLKETGIYAIAFYMGTVIEKPRHAIAQITTPILSQELANENHAKVQDLYRKSAINQLIVGGLLFLGVWGNIDAIFRIIPNAETYEAGKYVVLFIGLARLIEMGAGVSAEIIVQSKYYKFNFIGVVSLSILLVITNLIFIPIYGITGAALATMLSVLLGKIINFIFIWKKFGVQPFDLRTLALVGILLLTYFLSTLLPAMPSVWIDIFLRSALITVVFLGLTYVLRISEEFNGLVVTILRKVLS